MLESIINQIDNAKDKLDNLIMKYGLSHKKVIEQSQKLDDLIMKYYSINQPKRAWIM